MKRILGVVLFEHSTTHPPAHRAVPMHECSKGRFVPMLDEAPQELPVGPSRAVLRRHGPAKVLNDLANLVVAMVVSLQV